MPFRLWYQGARLAAALLWVLFFLWALFPAHAVTQGLITPVLYVLVALGATGGAMGCLMAFGKLRMRCPYCTRYGLVRGNRQVGLWLECGTCGVVRGSGLLKWRLTRDRKQAPEAPTPEE